MSEDILRKIMQCVDNVNKIFANTYQIPLLRSMSEDDEPAIATVIDELDRNNIKDNLDIAVEALNELLGVKTESKVAEEEEEASSASPQMIPTNDDMGEPPIGMAASESDSPHIF